jgi:glycine/D-amino acid oxidase-like deaminating enzyme
MLQLPSTEISLWQKDNAGQTYMSFDKDIEVDVAIVGGGITGLTSAYLLKQSGLKVAVLEKRTVGAGTSGRTTGKVSSLHSLIYADLYQRLGRRVALDYAQANQAAVEKVAEIIDLQKIDCDWKVDDNYTYTTDTDEVPKYKREAEVALELGMPASFETKSSLPFDIAGAVKFSGQGKFNAQKYVRGLAEAVHGNGSYVFEGSRVTGIRDGAPARVKTGRGTAHAKDVIVATNVPTLPLMARGGFCILEYPTESYIVAGEIGSEFSGMYISKDKDNHSILPIKVGTKNMLLVGGGGHISGMRLSKDAHFRKLADYAETRLGLTEIVYKWSDRDYITYDGPPLIGKLYPWSKHVYIGSAYRKWGLSNGTAAAMILHDLIIGADNAWAKTFSPQRAKPILNIPRVAGKYLAGQS